MIKYAGITVEPIFDTIMDATTPAALWFASTVFSDITRRLCVKIKAQYQERNYVMYTPYLDPEDCDRLKDGVGKYHDRIIFRADDIETKELQEIVQKVKDETWSVIKPKVAINNDTTKKVEKKTDKELDELRQEYLGRYLQIPFLVFDENRLSGKNPILEMTPYIDQLELMRTFPATDEYNPLRMILAGEENARNKLIKYSCLFHEGDKNLLREDGKIWDIESIAAGKKRSLKAQKQKTGEEVSKESVWEERKPEDYFAFVAADADNMGIFLKSLSENGQNSEELIQEFSKRCLSYDKAAVQQINEFGGMPIYAGGDDLLFIAPLVSGTETVFQLCKEIGEKFREIIEEKKEQDGPFEGKPIPTVSFGVAIQYKKYPLYEAQKHARQNLDSAKKMKGKNCMCITLEKHSGQSTGITVGNEVFWPKGEGEQNEKEKHFLDSFLQKMTAEAGNQELMLKSIGTKLSNYRTIITLIDEQYKQDRQGGKDVSEKNQMEKWDNLFDNEGQNEGKGLIHMLCKWYYDYLVYGGVRIYANFDMNAEKDKMLHGSSNHLQENEQINTLLAILRLAKFFFEKKGEK